MFDDASDRISITSEEFFLLWFAHRPLRDFPYFFGINPVGRSRKERAEYTVAASEQLAERGLGTVDDPEPDLMTVVDVLAGTPARIEFTCTGQDLAMWAVCAVEGSRAAVATRTGTDVQLGVQDASVLVTSLMDNAPQIDPGPGTSANLTVDEYERAWEAYETDGVGAFQDVVRSSGIHSSEVPTILRTVEDKQGGGTLAVKLRDDDGNWEHAMSRMSWVDTAAGRYATRHDDEWVTVTPADGARLKSIGREVLAQLEVVE